MTDDNRILRTECDECDWTLTREGVIKHLESNNQRTDERRIRAKFASLREGHAYFHRGHAPDYIREESDD